MNNGVRYNLSGRGFITLLSVLLIGTIGTALAVSLMLQGIDTGRVVEAHQQSKEAGSLADACAEASLKRIRDSVPTALPLAPTDCGTSCPPPVDPAVYLESMVYTGSVTLNLGQGSCVANVTSRGSGGRTIQSTGTVGPIVRKVEVIITTSINQIVAITSWEEVADF